MLELVAQSEEDVESWKASLLRAGVYPTRSPEEEQSNSPVSGQSCIGGKRLSARVCVSNDAGVRADHP